VPLVAAALGPVAGYAAARLCAAHFSLMTRGAQVLVGGPALVERATGENVSKEELGGPEVHGRSGVVDNVAADEADAWYQIRRFLSYLPGNVWEAAPVQACDDPRERREASLLEIVPRDARKPYKMRRLIESIVDAGSFFELTPGYGRTQITGLARANGQPIGVLANDPYVYAGSMTADGAQKLRRFVELCDVFHLPILSLVDEPGFMIGRDAEQQATIRYGLAALFAVQQSAVPWLSVLVRRSFGVAAGCHLGPAGVVLAWPSAQSGALPLESGVALAYAREIAASPDPEARRRELEAEHSAAQSIFPRAEDFGVHDLIDPRETRPRLCDWIDEIGPALAQLRGPRAYSPRP
jgi:acetyl-CoA carboxylase carboxyltransferase component